MDRAHRLGQTKQVTVYRLITKDTVDERILQLARQKQLVQNAVVGSSGAAMPSEGPAKANEVVSLLLDDNELQEGLRQADEKRKRLEEKKTMEGKKYVSLLPPSPRCVLIPHLSQGCNEARGEPEDEAGRSGRTREAEAGWT
jgi:hypothetical protein